MPIRQDQFGRTGVLYVDGDFTGDDAAQARAEVDALLAGGRASAVVFDFEKSPFLDSAGLETLLWALRRCEAAGGRMLLAGLDENCRRILRVTRLDHRFECHAVLPAALKAIE